MAKVLPEIEILIKGLLKKLKKISIYGDFGCDGKLLLFGREREPGSLAEWIINSVIHDDPDKTLVLLAEFVVNNQMSPQLARFIEEIYNMIESDRDQAHRVSCLKWFCEFVTLIIERSLLTKSWGSANDKKQNDPEIKSLLDCLLKALEEITSKIENAVFFEEIKTWLLECIISYKDKFLEQHCRPLGLRQIYIQTFCALFKTIARKLAESLSGSDMRESLEQVIKNPNLPKDLIVAFAEGAASLKINNIPEVVLDFFPK